MAADPRIWGPLEGELSGRGPRWDTLIARHGRRVVVSLLARGVPLERAKELAQEAWLRLIQQHRAGKLRELKLPGIAIRQAQLLAKDDRRRQGRRAAPRRSGDDGVDLEAQLSARQQLRAIERVVANSSDSTRRVFQMLYGTPPRDVAEVARELGLSVQRVRQILCELRKRIRRELSR